VSHAADAPPGHQAQILAEFSDEPRGTYLLILLITVGLKEL